MKTFPVLYSRGKKNEIRTWQITATSDSILVEHGVLGGELVCSERMVEGKNLGRANETSPSEQAVCEAEAKFKLKQRKGYSLSIPEVGTEPKLPMLAQKYETHQSKLTVGDTVVYQPKLDGARMVAYWEDGKLKLTSRTGVELCLPVLRSELERVLPKNIMFDGEVFIHQLMLDCAHPLADSDAFQTVMKLIKRQQSAQVCTSDSMLVSYHSDDLEYHVYDAYLFEIPEATYRQRQTVIDMLIPENTYLRSVQSVVTEYSPESVKVWHDTFVEQGYEGLMLRTGDCTYCFKHRSTQLLKHKVFLTEEFKIVGFQGGQGTRQGCAIWSVEVSPGVECKVAMTGSVAYQKQLYKDAHSHLGRMLTVKFQGYTGDGSLRFPTGVDIREEWDM